MGTEAYNARDLRTVACVPLSPYLRGYEDASYQGIYQNPYPLGSEAFLCYSEGHRDGMCGDWSRVEREAA